LTGDVFQNTLAMKQQPGVEAALATMVKCCTTLPFATKLLHNTVIYTTLPFATKLLHNIAICYEIVTIGWV
jgi:choline-glycine betaine transporter